MKKLFAFLMSCTAITVWAQQGCPTDYAVAQKAGWNLSGNPEVAIGHNYNGNVSVIITPYPTIANSQNGVSCEYKNMNYLAIAAIVVNGQITPTKTNLWNIYPSYATCNGTIEDCSFIFGVARK